MTELTPDPDSAAGLYGMEIATRAKHVVDELVEHDLMDDDLEPEDYAVACQIIADAIAKLAGGKKDGTP